MQHMFAPRNISPEIFQELAGLDTEAATLAAFVAFVWSPEWEQHRKTLRFMPTIMLYGPPGTGKTSILRNLAVKYSEDSFEYFRESLDLFAHKELGETSKAIEKLFVKVKERANCGKKVLLQLDDVDSLLSSRYLVNEASGVKRAVNTFLNQLDELAIEQFQFHPIVSATTNMPDQLDLAIKRRFSFKIEVAPELTAEHLRKLIEPMLILCSRNLSPNYDEIVNIVRRKNLTPSDVIRAVQVVYLRSRSGVEPYNEDVLAAFESADSSGGEYRAGKGMKYERQER